MQKQTKYLVIWETKLPRYDEEYYRYDTKEEALGSIPDTYEEVDNVSNMCHGYNPKREFHLREMFYYYIGPVSNKI